MIIHLEPMYGDTYSNTERAKTQLAKALGFRGTITEINAGTKRITANIEINPHWDIPDDEKVKYLQDWLLSRVHHFKVNFS